MHFYVYQDSQNQWRWRLVASNNRVIADSAEGYWNKDDCLRGIALVKQAYNAPVYQQ
jgi:uncharacterized protein YegP (UPF0339 family)